MKTRFCAAGLVSLMLFVGCASIDRSERTMLLQHHVSPSVYDKMMHGEVLTLSDIVELSQRQVPSSLMIRYLDSTRAIYTLDKSAMARLKGAKVCQEVIDYLVDTPARFAPRPVFYRRPYYVYDDYYPYYAPSYAPYPYYYGPTSVIVVGGRWHHR